MRNSRDELRGRLLAIFREEAADHLRSVAGGMAAIEGAGDGSAALGAVDGLFRTVHTLKGAARSLSITSIETICHDIEDHCSALVQGRAPMDADARQMLRALTDRLAEVTASRLAEIAAPPPAAVASPPSPPAPAAMAPQATDAPPSAPVQARRAAPPGGAIGEGPRFVRLDTAHIQRLGVMAEDLLAPRLAGRARLEEAQRLFAEIAAMRREQQSADRHGAATAGERRTGRALHAVEHAARHLAAGLSEDYRALRAMIDSLIVELREARMMPASELLAVFPAMVADLAGDVGKSVRWEAHGTDLLIDRQIAELIKDPLIHIVRNAVDHGIEPAEARLRAGKPAHGTVTLSIAPADGGRLAIEIADDGGGIDVAAVRESAVRGRLASREEVAAMTEEAVVDLVFQSTLSTRGAISAVSGRGLGLTIVRERAERLGGDVQLRSTPGKGTVLRLEMPAALANFRGVVVRLGDATLIWPRDAVERSVGLPASEVEEAASRGILPLDGEPVLFGHLADVLGQTAAEPPGEAVLRPGLVLRQGARRGVVIVDEIIGDSEVVVKELRPPLLRVRHVLAAGLLGTGQVALILRTGDVLDSLAGRKRKSEAPAGRRRRQGKYRLLVVDDSLTTRAMEVGLLEAAGYEVEAAADGLEAWASLQTNEFDAVVSDVDMPNMDGFELTERIRADTRLRQLPIVLVTALEKREDHDRGIRLGANAYMMKSAFDQSMLIDLVRRVI